jgi:hypothetical protein
MAPDSKAPGCDICGRPFDRHNHCTTCGKDVCSSCYVVRERVCHECFGTTLDLDAEEKAPEAAKGQPLPGLEKKKGCLGTVLLFIGALVLLIVLLAIR